MVSARHVIGCHLTQKTRVQNAFNDVASTVHLSLAHGGSCRWSPRPSHHGRAVQVGPMKPTLKAPGTKHLQLKYDVPLSNFAFKFNLRRYTMELRIRSRPFVQQSIWLDADKVGRCRLTLSNPS